MEENQKKTPQSRWKNYYVEYLKNRIKKRMQKGGTVKYTTLVKYDLIGEYF